MSIWSVHELKRKIHWHQIHSSERSDSTRPAKYKDHIWQKRRSYRQPAADCFESYSQCWISLIVQSI